MNQPVGAYIARRRDDTRLAMRVVGEKRDAALNHPAADALADLQAHLARGLVDLPDRSDDLKLVLVIQQRDRAALEGHFQPLNRASEDRVEVERIADIAA